MSPTSCAPYFNLVCLFAYLISVVEGQITFDQSCESPRSGTCINIWDCPFYVTRLKQKPQPPSFVNKMRQNLCGFVNSTTPKVCCQLNQRPSENEDITRHEKYHLLPMDICGPVPRQTSFGTRIVKGVNAEPGEFPWMALIAYQTGDSQDDQDFKCGGSLINERYVLTAAHCLINNDVLGVRLGEYDISSENDCYNGKCEPAVQDILIEKMKIHEKYDPNSHINDIALIRLATPANIKNGNVKPICLPTGDLRHANNLGKFLTVTGWGTTETGHNSMILRKVSIPVVPMKRCRNVYGIFAPISKKQICAGDFQGRDSCSGDSGGPLQYIGQMGQTHRYVIDGIVSYGSKRCGLDGWPAVYTNVKEYMSWILDNMKT